jgi:glutathione S-transferase
MKLSYAAGSPFVRKVTVSALETGLDDRIERVATNIREPDADFHRANPLGKVPAMLLDNGSAMIDSSVICAYLDTLHDGPKLIPEGGDAKQKALYLEALADGMTEAAVAVQRERGRPEDKQWDVFSDRQWGKIERALDSVEADIALLEGPLTLGHIALACGLGWIIHRLGDRIAGWEETRPQLAAWYGDFAQRASMQATVPK